MSRVGFHTASLLAILTALVLPDTAATQAPASEEVDSETQPAKDALLARIEASLERIDTLSADFVQTTQEGLVRRGTLSLDRPGKLRFEYTDGTPLLLVSDGKILTFVDYDIGQVTRWPIEDTALGLLVEDNIDLAGDKRVAKVESDPASGTAWLTARDPERPQEGTLTLEFEPGADGLTLRGWRIVDSRGALTQVQLHDMRRNLALADDSLWSFEDPRQLPSQRRRRRR